MGTLGGIAAYAGITPDGAGCATDDDGVWGICTKQNSESITGKILEKSDYCFPANVIK